MFEAWRAQFDRKFRRRALYQRVFAGADGRAVLADLAERHHALFNKTTFVEGDPFTSANQEGQRRVVIGILNILGEDLEAAFRLAELKEANNGTQHE